MTQEYRAKLLKKVTNQLMHDILILAKKVGYRLMCPLHPQARTHYPISVDAPPERDADRVLIFSFLAPAQI